MEGNFFTPGKKEGLTPFLKMFLRDMELAGYEGEQYALLESLFTENLQGEVKLEFDNQPSVVIATSTMNTLDDLARHINHHIAIMMEQMTPLETDQNRLPTISFTPATLH